MDREGAISLSITGTDLWNSNLRRPPWQGEEERFDRFSPFQILEIA
jgi:hypothetical protein